MKNVAANARYWIAGTAVAVVGLIVARVLAPWFGGTPRLALTVAGQLLGLGGLFIICLGVRQRIKRATDQ